MCLCGENSARGTLWTIWFPVTVAGLVYSALNVYTFSNLWAAYKSDKNTEKSETLTILVAALFCTFLILFFSVFSFLLLLFKSMGRSKAGFTYGFLTSSAANLALLLFLGSLMMTGYKDELASVTSVTGVDWNPRVFETTFSFGYISSFGYLVFFGAMFVLSTGIDDPARPDVEEPLTDN